MGNGIISVGGLEEWVVDVFELARMMLLEMRSETVIELVFVTLSAYT